MGHLWLIGMMGTGKTTVGALVAQQLGKPFVDLDTEVMVATGKTIHDLFAEGEEMFRSAESAVLIAAANRTPAVISTGGGAVLGSEESEHHARHRRDCPPHGFGCDDRGADWSRRESTARSK